MKTSERLLLTLFATLLLGGGALVMWDLYRDRREVLKTEQDTLNLELVEMDALLEDRDLWELRATWLDANQPTFTTRDQIDNAIFEDAQATNAPGVTTAEIQLLDAVETPHHAEAGVSLTATGAIQDVFGWLHRLQQPSEFRMFRHVKITTDPNDDSIIVCQLELVRWYAKKPK